MDPAPGRYLAKPRETLLIAAISFFNRGMDPIDPIAFEISSPLLSLFLFSTPPLPRRIPPARVWRCTRFEHTSGELARAAIAGQEQKSHARSSLWQFVNSANCRARVVNGRLPIIEPITNAELSGIHSLVNCNFLPWHANTRRPRKLLIAFGIASARCPACLFARNYDEFHEFLANGSL